MALNLIQLGLDQNIRSVGWHSNFNLQNLIYFFIFFEYLTYPPKRFSIEIHNWPASDQNRTIFSHDRPGSVTGRSVSRLGDFEPILLLPAAQAETSQPRTHSVACEQVILRELFYSILMAFSVNGDW